MDRQDSLFRDDNWLVVPLDTSVLDDRCLWTNEPANGQTQEIRIVDPKAGWETNIAFGIRPKVDRRTLRVPGTIHAWKDPYARLNAQKMELRKRLLLLSTPILLVSVLALYLLIDQAPRSAFLRSTGGAIIMLVIVAMGFTAGLGLFCGLMMPFLDLTLPAWMTTNVVKQLNVGLITDTHFWLPKAHPELMKSAPPWAGKKRSQVIAERPGLFQTLGNSWLTIVAWISVAALVAITTALIKQAMR